MSQASEGKKESRRSYNTPHLTVFGALRDLTTSGSGTVQEAGGGQGPPPTNPQGNPVPPNPPPGGGPPSLRRP